jgi:hypothetical protein
MVHADPLSLLGGLPHKINRRADVEDIAQRLVDETLSNQQTHDRLACARVQRDENVALVPIGMPLGQGLILTAPEIVERPREAGKRLENLDWIDR